MDKEIESGEYFLKERERKKRKMDDRKSQDAVAAEKQKEKRSKSFIPPKERKLDITDKSSSSNLEVDIQALKKKINKTKKKKT